MNTKDPLGVGMIIPMLACNLCGSDRVRVRFRSTRAHPAQPDPAAMRPSVDRFDDYGQVVQCCDCGLCFLSPRAEDSALLAAYAAAEDAEYMDEDASRTINGHFSVNSLRRYCPSGRLLDIGCSNGYLLHAARLHFETTGVEPSRTSVSWAKRQLQLNILEGTLESAKFPADHFDVVTLVDVIEHLTDPKSVLKEIWRILKPGGMLYIVTPDIGSPLARFMGSRWWGLRSAHLYYFSRKTLSRMLQDTGFKTISMDSYGRVFRMVYWLSRLKHYGPWINRAVRAFIERFQIGEKLVYINTFDSMECCAQKQVTPPGLKSSRMA